MLYFTVITKTYLPYAQVLMQRFAALDPSSTRLVFFADTMDRGQIDPAHKETFAFEIIALETYVAEAERTGLRFQYTAFELCNALRAFAHHHIFHHTAHQEWMYFDVDIYPLDHCHCLLAADTEASLFLTPHALTQTPSDQIVTTDAAFAYRGVFNSGWMGIRRSPDAEAFIEWFLERARRLFFVDYRNMFVDQLWLNFAPILFSDLHIVRHPGANVAYWNLHERALRREEARLLSNEQPVLFVHFSGWSPRQPERVSRYAPLAEANPLWATVAHQYARELLEAGVTDAENLSYSGEVFEDGSPIALSQRRQFYEFLLSREWPADLDPFTKPELLLPPEEALADESPADAAPTGEVSAGEAPADTAAADAERDALLEIPAPAPWPLRVYRKAVRLWQKLS